MSFSTRAPNTRASTSFSTMFISFKTPSEREEIKRCVPLQLRSKSSFSANCERRAPPVVNTPRSETSLAPNSPGLLFPLRPHPPAAQISVVPAQGFTQQVRSVASIRQALGAAEVVQQQRLVVRRGALLDDKV